ncbi:class I SAM-dependent methyltransferase [Thermomonas sp.]|uniref:class I SAM-dependent methyltransferase n=1 Tax=Thermomonas sp. TaxID=1971895 RepID=UPI00378523B8
MIKTSHPNGHFYSPVVDTDELSERMNTLWPDEIPECPGITFNDESIVRILTEWFPRFMPDFNYSEQLVASDESQFFIQNSQFSWLDCRALFVILRQLQPEKIVEIGSGFSSLLTADVNRRFFMNSMEFICVEPYPRAFLSAGVAGISHLDVRKVQEIEPAYFDRLNAGDVLFIDSSHVCKTGSDVNHLYLKVLPRLKSGVIIHIHDIFLPFEYLKTWVLEENRSWNEQYLSQAMLQHSARYEMLFASYYAYERFPALVVNALNTPKGHGYGGSSMWLKVK